MNKVKIYMGSWPSKVPVDDDDSNQNRDGVHYEGE